MAFPPPRNGMVWSRGGGGWGGGGGGGVGGAVGGPGTRGAARATTQSPGLKH